MKQSTKLLSLVLAIVMAFSCMAVIGNAALVKSEVSWDNIDDAQLTAEQVADLALDLVDNDLLAGMETIDLSILGELRLNSINNILTDITSLRDSVAWSIGSGLLGDLGDLDFDPLLQSGSYGLLSSHTAYQRSHGDINVIMALLELIGNDNNSNIISKIAYGLGTSNGISLGLIGNFLDLGSIGDLLGDIPMLLKSMAYDMLIYGSYGYDQDFEEMGNTLPTSVDTLDEILMQAIGGLLVNPQHYDYENNVKVWDEDSLIMPTVAAYGLDTVKDFFNINGSANDWDGDGTADQNNFFQILDKLAPFAIYDLGVGALNNNLKKTLLEAVEVEFNEIDVAVLPADIAADFEVDAEDGKESYVTYIAYDRIAQAGEDFYYTTLETEPVMVNGEPSVDEDGNEITQRVRKYFKANTATANDFYSLIDFGWEFVAPKPFSGEEESADFGLDNLSALNYKALIAEYGSIMESLNHLLYVVFETAVKQDVKDYFADMTGDYWVDGATTETYSDGTSIFMDNASRLLKYLLAEHADKIFGSDSPYVAWEYDDIADYELLDIIAIMGPVFFEDVMPQLIMPKNADGTYAFHDGVQVLEFGALVIREFMTEIAPNVNYDQYIFAEGTVTSANDRQFKVQDADTWYNIILNIGLDIAYTYLNNITNFNTAIPTQAITEARWKDMLGTIVTWAAEYVSDGTNSVIHGFEPAKLEAYTDPLDKFSYVLNTLLPLGFICGCTTDSFAFDVSVVFDKLKSFLTTFDLTVVASLFGRNDQAYNILADDTLITVVLTLVNDIVNLVLPISENGDGVTGLLQGVDSKSLDTVVSQANLKITVQQLLRALYTQGRELLNCALPVLGMFIKGWGTEQQFNEPQISLSRSIDLTNGATAAAVDVTIRNASNGVWRHYRDAAGNEYTDEQYKIQLKSVAVNDEFGETDSSSYVTITSFPTDTVLDYGQSGTFQYTAANVPTSGKLVRFKVGYQVLDESGATMSNGKIFYSESSAWLNYNPTNEGQETYFNNNGSLTYAAIYGPRYVPISSAMDYIPEIVTGKMGRDYKLFTSSQKGAITAATATVDGITFGNVSMTFSNVSGGRYFNDLKQFQTYTVQATNEDGDEQSGSGNALTVSGSVNEATWKAANKTSGSTSNWSITLTAKGTTNGPHNLTLYYYDDINYNKLTSLAASEMDAMRLASAYNLSGKVYAGGVLESANTTDEDGETVYRDTNFTETAWVANADAGKWAGSYTGSDGTTYTETVTTYADSAVTVTDEEGENGYVTVDGEKINVKKVTVIDCATAINNYVPAYLNGVQGGMQAWNANSVYDFQARYEALYVASNDIGYCKKGAVQVVNEGGGDNIDAAVNALKADLDASEATYSDDYDYTDYKMYRWNRYNDARDDAKYYIQLQNDASNATVDEIDETFPYTWINEDDLRTLVAGDKYEDFITALLEPMSEEEKEATAQWLKSRKEEYQTRQLLDVEMATNYLDKMGPRLLKRDHGVITTYLDDEITSANNMVKAESNYTARSWAKYEAAMDAALEVQANPTQMTVFDAKYELMTARNELVLVENEADYSELEALIAQATQALANADLYDNTNKELGQVLAELGYYDFENADGDMVQLFPMSALYVNSEPYATDDQDVIDAAATALKEALARLKFKGLNITGAGVATEVIVPGDEEAGIEDITASVARIAPELDADAVKALLGATATSANVTKDLITVSNDIHYTVDTDLENFTGTNATVTFYTLVGGVKVPVATVKIVVEADVNGDGATDVLDGALTELVANSHAELSGCYFLAGNLDAASEEIVAADYSAVVNKILA